MTSFSAYDATTTNNFHNLHRMEIEFDQRNEPVKLWNFEKAF